MSAFREKNSYKVRLLDHDIEGSCLEDDLLLTGLNKGNPQSPFPPQPCKDGECGNCKCWLYRGNVISIHSSNAPAISQDEREAGLILPCMASPQQDCDLIKNYHDKLVIHPHMERTIPVVEIERISPSITRVRLGPLDHPVSFSAGQFMRVTFQDQPSRDYSIASLAEDLFLEFHIMLSPNGSASQHVHHTLSLADSVHVKGPYGHAHYREQCEDPIICFANGTGLAPMRSIAETALHKPHSTKVTLLWHMDNVADFYWINHFEELSVSNSDFNFHRLADQDLADLDKYFPKENGNFRAYTAGAPHFVDRVIQKLLDHRQPENMIHSDAFHSDIVMEENNIPGYINN